MDKKILIAIFSVFLISIPIIIASIPQFILFQGEVKIDGRIAPQGTIINFSIEGIEIANAVVNESGKYGLVFIQNFQNLYGKPITITIINNTEKYETEEKINYIYPQDIYLNLSTLTENALNIADYYPKEEKIIVSEAGNLSFNISTESGYNDSINYSWLLDENIISSFSNISSSSFTYKINNNASGIHNIKAIANDGYLKISKEWTLIIGKPITENFDGDTTNFSKINLDELTNVKNVVFEKNGNGKIEFLESLNLKGVYDIENAVKIIKGIVAINSSKYPQLNKSATITLTGLSYSTIPKIFYNNGFTITANEITTECDFCNILNYTNAPTSNGTVVFKVEHFSSFKTGESGDKYNLNSFSDLNLCKKGIIGDLKLKIKKPYKKDNFQIGDTININVEVTNNANEDKNIVVKTSLYNINKDDREKSVESKDEKVKEKDDKTFKLKIDVPDNFDNGDNYLIFVKAYEDGEEKIQCNQNAVEISLEREKHDVIIKDTTIAPQIIYSGKNIDVFVDIKNVGEKNENVYVILENSALKIYEKSETFELEKYGDNDFSTKMFFVKIPSNAKEGKYPLKIKIMFNDKSYEKTKTISVLKELSLTKLDKKTKIIKIGKKSKKLWAIHGNKFPDKKYLIVFELALGIIILFLLIIKVLDSRKKHLKLNKFEYRNLYK